MVDGMIDIDVKLIEDILVCDVFGIDSDMMVKGFVDGFDCVLELDSIYKFDLDIMLVILVGFFYNCCVMI